MKMKRNLIILGIVAVIAIAFAVAAPVVFKPAPSATPAPTATVDPSLLSVSAKTLDKVSEVTIENAKESFTVYKNGDKYVVKGKESLNLDQSAAETVFSSVSNITAEELVAQDPKDLSVYGLDMPLATATAKYTDGTTATYLVGSMTAARNAYYFMVEGGNKVYTVWQNIGNTYSETVDSLLMKRALTVTKDTVASIRVVKNGETVLDMDTNTDISNVSLTKWVITKPWKRSVDANALTTYLTSVFDLKVSDIVAGEPKDLAQYGLDKPVYDLTLQGDGKTDEILVGSDKDEYTSYVKFANEPAVYSVEKSSLTFLNTTASQLMDKIILLVNIQEATGVVFDGLGQHVKMDITNTPQKDANGDVRKDSNGKPINDQKFTSDSKDLGEEAGRAFYTDCIALATHSEIDKSKIPAAGTAPIATVTYTRINDPKEIKIEFLPYDQDFYAVRYNGSVDFLIMQSKIQAVADDAVKLMNGTLATPTPSAVNASPTPAESAAAPTAAPAASTAPVKVPDSSAGTVMLIVILAGVVAAGILLLVVMRKKK